MLVQLLWVCWKSGSVPPPESSVLDLFFLYLMEMVGVHHGLFQPSNKESYKYNFFSCYRTDAIFTLSIAVCTHGAGLTPNAALIG